MRRVPLALAMLVTAQPSLAAEHHTPTLSPDQAAQALESPIVQEAAAKTLTQLAGILLDTRVGPLAALADPRDHVRASDTLRDLKHRDDPHYEQHLERDTRRALGTAGALAGGAVAETAELRRTAARLREVLAPLIGSLAPAGEEERARD
jgi:hypothetical protein